MLTDQQEEDLLRNYLDHMVDLYLQLRASQTGNAVRSLAHALTFTTLERLDPDRKGVVVRFLNDAELLAFEQPIVSLIQANLSAANLSAANLINANLSLANLNGANLSAANLNGANLINANLSATNLSGANLSATNLSGANLNGANLINAYLSAANLSAANLRGALVTAAQLAVTSSLTGARLPDGSLHS